MKENKYDDESFFRKYGEMGRSKEGLIAAGEWETMKALLPDFKGKRMLDIGCGLSLIHISVKPEPLSLKTYPSAIRIQTETSSITSASGLIRGRR